MTEPIKEYTPAPIQPNKSNIPKPSYELKSTLTGKIMPPIFIGQGDIKIQVPHVPKENCKKCRGKGYLGIDTKNKKIFVCHKCYPPTQK